MNKPIEVLDLGDLYEVNLNSDKSLFAKVICEIYEDTNLVAWDEETQQLIDDGKLIQYTVRVTAQALDCLGFDVLGGVTAENLSDVTNLLEEHELISNALNELTDNIIKKLELYKPYMDSVLC